MSGEINASIDIGKNVTGLIEQLAHQIGVTADKVFPWYVKQQIIEGYVFLTILAIVFLLAIVLVTTCYKRADFGHGNKFTLPAVAVIILLALSLLELAVDGTTAITKIINPNYYAMSAIALGIAKLTGK